MTHLEEVTTPPLDEALTKPITKPTAKKSRHKTKTLEELAAKADAKALKKQAKQAARNTPEAIEARKRRKYERDRESKARRKALNPKPTSKRSRRSHEELAEAKALKASKALKTKPTKPIAKQTPTATPRPLRPTQKLKAYYVKAYKYAGEVIEESPGKASKVYDRAKALNALESARQEARSNAAQWLKGINVFSFEAANRYARLAM